MLLLEKLRTPHSKKKSMNISYIVTVRLKTLESVPPGGEMKYTLKNKVTFVKEYQGDTKYTPIHNDAREHFKVPPVTMTFLGVHKNPVTIEDSFPNVESFYTQSKAKKKSMLLYLYYPKNYGDLVRERLTTPTEHSLQLPPQISGMKVGSFFFLECPHSFRPPKFRGGGCSNSKKCFIVHHFKEINIFTHPG